MGIPAAVELVLPGLEIMGQSRAETSARWRASPQQCNSDPNPHASAVCSCSPPRISGRSAWFAPPNAPVCSSSLQTNN